MPWSHPCWSSLHWPQRTPVLGSEGPGHLVQSHMLSCGFQSPAPMLGWNQPSRHRQVAGQWTLTSERLSLWTSGVLPSGLRMDCPSVQRGANNIEERARGLLLGGSCTFSNVSPPPPTGRNRAPRDGRVIVGPGRSCDILPQDTGAWLPCTQ